MCTAVNSSHPLTQPGGPSQKVHENFTQSDDTSFILNDAMSDEEILTAIKGLKIIKHMGLT